MAHPAVVIIA